MRIISLTFIITITILCSCVPHRTNSNVHSSVVQIRSPNSGIMYLVVWSPDKSRHALRSLAELRDSKHFDGSKVFVDLSKGFQLENFSTQKKILVLTKNVLLKKNIKVLGYRLQAGYIGWKKQVYDLDELLIYLKK